MVGCCCYLYILNNRSPLDEKLAKIFSIQRLPLCSNDGVLCSKKLSSFMKFHLLNVSLNACAIGVIFRKSFPISISSSISKAFSSIRFRVSSFMLRCLIYSNSIELIFVQVKREESSLILLCAAIPSNLTNTISWRRHLFSSVCWWPLCQKSGGYMSVGLHMGPQFYSIVQWLCFYASTMLFLLL